MHYGLTFLVLLALVLLEQGWLYLRHRRPIDWHNLTANLNSGHLIMWLLRGAEVAAYGGVLHHASFGWVGTWVLPAQWLFAFVAWDAAFYLMHRCHHLRPLWRIHAAHHGGTEMSLSLAIRNAWLSSISDFPFMLPLAVLGVPLHMFVAVSSLHYGIQFFNHIDSAVVDRLGFLEGVIVTPSAHRAHHGLQEVYHDKNFGSFLLVWDRLFGTYQPEDRCLERLYGLAGPRPVNNAVAMNIPGLRPVLERWRPCTVPAPAVGTGSVLLFCWVGFAVERARGSGQWQLDALIAVASIALGLAADNRRAGVRSWLVLAAALSGWTVVFAPAPVPLTISAVTLAHAAWTASRTRPI